MTKNRATCEQRDRCGATGHYQENGSWKRCPCLEAELEQKILGPMFTERIPEKTRLEERQGTNTVLEGPIASVKKHAARVLLGMRSKGKTWLTIDAYRLIDIFLGEDKEHDSQYEAIDPDLLILLLGFADPRNKYLPELVLQVLSRREMMNKPSWVILGIPRETVATKYSSELSAKLDTFTKVAIR